jgi:hypothetical protein
MIRIEEDDRNGEKLDTMKVGQKERKVQEKTNFG